MAQGVSVIYTQPELTGVTGLMDSVSQALWLEFWRCKYRRDKDGRVILSERHFEEAVSNQGRKGMPPGVVTESDIVAYQAVRAKKYYLPLGDRTRITLRTPKWANLDAIKRIYQEARRLSAETGVKHSVDHVLPLKGKTVTGLHVESNLRIMTLSGNIRKGNRWGSDG